MFSLYRLNVGQINTGKNVFRTVLYSHGYGCPLVTRKIPTVEEVWMIGGAGSDDKPRVDLVTSRGQLCVIENNDEILQMPDDLSTENFTMVAKQKEVIYACNKHAQSELEYGSCTKY